MKEGLLGIQWGFKVCKAIKAIKAIGETQAQSEKQGQLAHKGFRVFKANVD